MLTIKVPQNCDDAGVTAFECIVMCSIYPYLNIAHSTHTHVGHAHTIVKQLYILSVEIKTKYDLLQLFLLIIIYNKIIILEFADI